MDAPKVDEAVKEQIRKEYAEFDLDGLLNDTNNAEENKDGYQIDTSKRQIYSLFSQVQDCISSSKATPLPSTETVFGADAVQPLQPPLYFNLREDERNFETGVGPWRLSRD